MHFAHLALLPLLPLLATSSPVAPISKRAVFGVLTDAAIRGQPPNQSGPPIARGNDADIVADMIIHLRTHIGDLAGLQRRQVSFFSFAHTHNRACWG